MPKRCISAYFEREGTSGITRLLKMDILKLLIILQAFIHMVKV